jgi:hypothetical protein
MDEFYLVVRCAVYGGYSRALYGRAPGGMFVPKSQLVKVEAAHAGAEGTAAGPSPEIAANMISLPVDPCLWCGGRLVYSHVHCGRCKRLVCTGRSYLEGGALLHVCHEDCGSRGPVTLTATSYGVEPKASPGPATPPGPALPAASKQPGQSLALPGKGRAVSKK